MKLAIASLFVGTVGAARNEVAPSTSRKLNTDCDCVPYTFLHSPPAHPQESNNSGYSHPGYFPTDLQIPCSGGDSMNACTGTATCNGDWVSACRNSAACASLGAPHKGEYQNSGDTEFYFTLDLGSSIDIDRLRVRNRQWSDFYCVYDFEVSVSDSQDSGYSAPICGTLVNDSTLNQDIAIGLSGRYIKFQAVTYCNYGAGLYYLGVLTTGQSGNADCPNIVTSLPQTSTPKACAPTGSPTGSPSNSPTTPAPTGSPTGSPSNSPTGSSTGSPTGSPLNSPTGGPTNAPTGSQGAGGAAAGQLASGAAASTSAADSLYYPDWTKGNGGCKTGGGQPLYMTRASSTWMFATLDACCSKYFSWMLIDCKDTSGAAPSGLWYPDWTGPDNTCKNDGSEPQYMALNPGSYMHSSKQACCKANFSWMLNGCLGSSASPTDKWFMIYDSFKCKKDCVAGTGPSCGGRAESWDELFDTRTACCAKKASWNPTDCLVD